MASVGLSGVGLRRANRPVIEHVTLSVGPSEIVVLTGGRGSGKSSLLAVAAGMLRPDTGEVVAGGRRIIALQSASLPGLRRYIGYLPARPPFIEEETPLENLMLALAVRGIEPDGAACLAGATLKELGLSPSPRPLAQLSAAERRLIALGRVLCGPPPVLLLDDPTQGLDAPDRLRVLNALLRVRDLGSAILWAITDPDLARTLAERGARVLELRAGRIVGGPPAVHLVAAEATTENTEVTPVSQAASPFAREAR
jgi:ABC-type multidrug transport system ATPase subunit